MKRIMILLPALLLMAGSAGTVRAEIPGEGSLAAVQDASRRISGKIVDRTGAPVIGASVMVPGTLQGAVSDMDGNFSLDVEAGVSVLDVSCIGYAAYRLELGDGNVYEIVLSEDRELLDEVVVVGYGTQKKVNLTGSVASMSFESIGTTSRPMFNASQALAGAIPGLQVMQGSGNPYNEGFSYNIRGTGTLNSSGPLILVDGMEQSIGNINPADIASITVLKDAASCAIYGNRGANGVILVTTKSGEEGKVSISYDLTFSYDEPFKIIHTVSNYAQYMELMNESSYNVGGSDLFSHITINQWREAEKDPNGIADSGYPNYVAYPNTDWWDEIYQNKWMQKHSLSVNGKSGKVGYNMSLAYINNPGIIENTGYKRYFGRVNVYADVTDWLTVGTRIWGYLTDREKGNVGSLTSLDTQKMVPGVYPYYNGMYGAPEANEEDPQSHNPLWDMNLTRGYNKHTQLFTTWYAKVKFLKYFSYDINLYYKDYREEQQSIDTDYGKYSFSTDQWVAAPKDPKELYTYMYYNRENHYKLTQLLNYHQTVRSHDISAMLGYEEEHFVQRNGSLQKLGLQDASIGDPSSAATPYASSGSGYEWGARSVFARVNYALKERYLFEANVRVDGSSRFAPAYRWGVFPSFSAGWRISEEPFLKSTHWIDNLKIRASWGQLGNNAIGNYEWQSTYGAANYVVGNTVNSGIAITSIANVALEWEKTSVANVGVDFSFFNNRFTGSVDAYDKLTTGILYRPDMYMVMGTASAPRQNIADVSNRGIEVELGWKDSIGKDFYYGITANVSFNRNRVTKYKGELVAGWSEDPEGNPVYSTNIGDVSTGSTTRVIEGHQINEWYLPDVYKGSGRYWNADGSVNKDGGPRDGMIRTVDDMKWLRAMVEAGYTFYPSQNIGKAGLWYGEYIYADANGDGIYGNSYDSVFQGTSTTPKYNYGLQFYAGWKGIDLSVSLSGAAGFSIYYYRMASNSSATIYGYTIAESVAEDHYFFDPKNPDDPRTNITSKQPRLSNLSGNDQSSASSSLHLEKGDFLKLRNVTIGYTLPEKISKKIKAQSIRVFASGENLCAITGFSGMDPEMRATAGYSTMRQYALGLNVTF